MHRVRTRFYRPTDCVDSGRGVYGWVEADGGL
jgi:hypothetical protein